MRIFYSLTFIILLAILSINGNFFTKNTYAQVEVFYRTLKLGSSGQDVYQLQKILNSDPETVISSFGAGSPGKETSYFGVLTKNAIIRFQEKNSAAILVPNNLSAGTGFVGKSTLSVLNKTNNMAINNDVSNNNINSSSNNSILLNQNSSSSSQINTVSNTGVILGQNNFTPISDTDQISNQSLNQNENLNLSEKAKAFNPNLKNLDIFLSEVEKLSKNKGIDVKEIELVKNQIVLDVMSTTTNLLEEFEKKVKNDIAKNYIPEPAKNVFSKVSEALSMTFKPQQAKAGTGTPFGGMILFSFYCTCSNSWLLTLTPIAPTYVTLLTYITGSQAFLSYNIPFTLNLLGEYTSGSGVCLIYAGTSCSSVSSSGLINPLVGSSL